MKKAPIGSVYGFLGVLGFSLTLPATRLAVAELDPIFVGLGRSVLAAGLAIALLFVRQQPLPAKRFLPQFALVASGIVLGFPVLTAWSMQWLPASHGAVVIGLLPLATALAAVWRAGEHPSPSFWLFSGLGSILVIAFALSSGSGSLHWADGALFGAVIAAALGYAEGTVLSKQLGSWQVICWTLVFSLPLLLPLLIFLGLPDFASVSPSAWLGFLYVSWVSMFLAYIAWYKGLSTGGIALVGQLQLLQPFLTIFAAALLLKEPVEFTTFLYAGGVCCCVLLGRKIG